ncbi:succinyl-diaminopimelate desuccinylase [Jatrophihabitans cynanchi]|uniref:Succinyl-diaminopimelate desuccinylase n=1 Tax=Jatrophihabitans cynanchi TaxID=2944128 RepID=A0ABY7JU49_9ACTN|nr:succinyl-diaminopimelate desuccinylase [Jatrophihabitans sp. SB3-54]WAX56078.1 succinyl-diaminopimelate desuccinylase [Jatrophihabitans sp. SB3-54]
MLDLGVDAGRLTAALVDIESVSGNEAALADQVETALRGCPGLSVERDGNVVLARTDGGRTQRVVLAGHLDTVPIAGNVPSRVEGDLLHGCGATDMKSGLAVMLRVAHLVGTGELRPGVELTWVCYDCEEVEAARNGLGRLARDRPDVLAGDLAILLEPTDGGIEGGCQGTLRAVVRTRGVRAHSARSWLGENAIHAAAPILARLAEYRAREVDVEGLRYREGLNAVAISGGVAGNVIPDECTVTVNYRFAPDRSAEQAEQHVREVFVGFELDVTDLAPAARPGLDSLLPKAIVAAVGREPRAKLGWTDVARFGELGIPAVNFGPGDSNLAHKPEEHVSLAQVRSVEGALVRFLARD